MQKEEILAEVKRTAQENGGKPLGKGRFESVTGITPRDWLRYWARFGDMQREAGFEPNQLQGAYDDEYILEKMVSLMRELGVFPTIAERRRKAMNDPDFPSHSVFERLGNRDTLISKLYIYCKDRPGYEDAIEIIVPLYKVPGSSNDMNIPVQDVRYGFVYLVKGHPGEYKIGRTNLVDRRLSELGATASIQQSLIHEIKTDDPAGIEAYWHRRFQGKRMRGEWFKLTAADVRAFKRWRRIF
jgi:hypothetical protein